MNKDKKAIYWLSAAHGITDTYSGFLTPLMPFIAIKLGFSLAIATMIMSVSQAISSTIQPLFGYFSDIGKKRFFIFWGLLIASFSNPIATNVNSFWLLCLFIILGSLGGSMYHPQAMGLISKFSEKNIVYNMSVFVTMGTLGYAVGPIISSYIYQFLGSEKLLLTSYIGIITALLMFFCIPKLDNKEFNPQKYNILKCFKNIFKSKEMIILITIGLMKTLIQSSTSIMIPFLWKDLGYSPIYIGFGMFLFLFAGGIGSFTSHWFEKKLGAKFVFYSSLGMTLPLMIIYALTYKFYPVFGLCTFILIGFLTAFAQPLTIVMAQEIMPDYKSIVSGIINGLTWGVVSVMLIGLGIVAEKIGIMQILILLAVLPTLTALLVKYLPDKILN